MIGHLQRGLIRKLSLKVAPNDILQMLANDHNTKYVVAPRHDLEMVVKTVFQSGNCCTYSEIRKSRNPKAILAFWEYHLQSRVWQNMLQAARECNYKGLIAQIVDFLPSLKASTE